MFASDGSLYQGVDISVRMLPFPAERPDLSYDLKVKATGNGNYVVSGSTIEFISGERVNIEADVSINTGGIPELEQLENEWRQEFEQEIKPELEKEFGLELTTYTWRLDGDRLTLRGDTTDVF